MNPDHTPQRRKLPNTRRSVTRKEQCGLEYYVTVSFFEDGSPGEVFIKIAKNGSTLAGMCKAVAVTISIALQYGVPWEVLRRKYTGTKFDPSTDNHTSLLDAIAATITEVCDVQNKKKNSF